VFATALSSAGQVLKPPRPWEVRAAGWFGPDELPRLHPVGAVLVDTDAGLLTRADGEFRVA
jgi:hypothetical protein